MKVTIDQLSKIYPAAAKAGRIAKNIDGLNKTLAEFEINTPIRIAAFLSQIGKESEQLLYVRELGSNTYLDKYDTGKLAEALGNTPADDDDGQLYRGRGYIQVTGRTNYKACGAALGLDLVNHPELLEIPENAWRSAGWYWKTRKCNVPADAGDIMKVTRLVNGGLNGYDERVSYWKVAKTVLGV